MELKTFHCSIQNDHTGLKAEDGANKQIPRIRTVDNAVVQRNYIQVRQDVMDLVEAEMGNIMLADNLKCLIVKK